MPAPPEIGLIGVGEAGFAIAEGLTGAGLAVHGYDVRVSQRDFAATIARAGIVPADDVATIAGTCEIIIVLTTATSARAVAESLVPFLTEHHIVSDWNSASPRLKQQLAAIVDAAGANFVDGAVMAAVPPRKHRVPVFLSGEKAPYLAELLGGVGCDVRVVGRMPGQAAAAKMLRSLVVKGLEALFVEFLVAANPYGLVEDVLSSITETLPTEDWTELAEYLVDRSLQHSARRAEELRQVAITLADDGVEPLVARGAAARLQWLAAQWRTAPDARPPHDLQGLADFVSAFGDTANRSGMPPDQRIGERMCAKIVTSPARQQSWRKP